MKQKFQAPVAQEERPEQSQNFFMSCVSYLTLEFGGVTIGWQTGKMPWAPGLKRPPARKVVRTEGP